MDTPASLVAVLKLKLPAEGSANLAREKPRIAPAAVAVAAPHPSRAPVTSGVAPLPPPALPSTPQAGTSPKPMAVARAGHTPVPSTSAKAAYADQKANVASAAADRPYMVQAATMSTLERAQKVAGSIGGSIAKAGQYFRVRTGPFATRDQAQASLAKVRAAGYTDARIFTNG
jgi:rare lipoprotein A